MPFFIGAFSDKLQKKLEQNLPSDVKCVAALAYLAKIKCSTAQLFIPEQCALQTLLSC